MDTLTGARDLPSGKEVGKHSLKAPVGVQEIGLVHGAPLCSLWAVFAGLSCVPMRFPGLFQVYSRHPWPGGH